MADSTRFSADPADFEDPAPPRRSWLATCLGSCLGVVIVLGILIGVIAYIAAKNWRGWVADFGAEKIKRGIEASELPQQEKGEIGVQVDRVATAIREGRISRAEIERLGRLLIESPLATSLAVVAVEGKYFDQSGLSDEEKTAGRLAMRRFARGVIDQNIPEDKRDETIAILAHRQQDGSWQPRDSATDEELRKFLASAKAAADAAGIEPEPEVVDPSDELKRIVDEALAEEPADE
jgi:hypothetical protein